MGLWGASLHTKGRHTGRLFTSSRNQLTPGTREYPPAGRAPERKQHLRAAGGLAGRVLGLWRFCGPRPMPFWAIMCRGELGAQGLGPALPPPHCMTLDKAFQARGPPAS